MRTMRSIVFALASLAAGTAGAADSGFYFSVSGGQAKYDFQPLPSSGQFVSPCFGAPVGWDYCNLFISSSPPRFIGVVNGNFIYSGSGSPPEVFWVPGKDDEATTWSALAGYRFLRFLAVEVAYNDFGSLHEFSPSQQIGPLQRTLEAEADMETIGATLAILGSLPITDQWNVYVRAGGMYADQDVSRRLGMRKERDSYSSNILLYGVGTELNFGSHWGVRLDAQRYNDVGKGNGVGKADIDVLSLGVLFRL